MTGDSLCIWMFIAHVARTIITRATIVHRHLLRDLVIVRNGMADVIAMEAMPFIESLRPAECRHAGDARQLEDTENRQNRFTVF